MAKDSDLGEYVKKSELYATQWKTYKGIDLAGVYPHATNHLEFESVASHYINSAYFETYKKEGLLLLGVLAGKPIYTIDN